MLDGRAVYVAVARLAGLGGGKYDDLAGVARDIVEQNIRVPRLEMLCHLNANHQIELVIERQRQRKIVSLVRIVRECGGAGGNAVYTESPSRSKVLEQL